MHQNAEVRLGIHVHAHENELDELIKNLNEERRTVTTYTRSIVHCQVSLQIYPVVTAKLEMNLTEWIVCWQGKL